MVPRAVDSIHVAIRPTAHHEVENMSIRRLAILSALAVTLGVSVGAQKPQGLIGDLSKDVSDVHTKIVGLAKAVPATAYDWKPSPEVRSTGEVFMHVAADNYFMPAAMGIAPPAATGIIGTDYKTAAAFEKKKMSRDEIIAELDTSFAFLQASMAGVTDAKLEAPLEIFGQKSTGRAMWVSTTTHLHEHLGQLIAYARSNKVTPPWSK